MIINEENNSKNGEKIFIQIALSLNDEKNDHTRIWKLNKDQRHLPKMVVTFDDFTCNSMGGIKHQSLFQFLITFDQ